MISARVIGLAIFAGLVYVFRNRLFGGGLPPGPPPPPPPPDHEIYVASLGSHSILGFALNPEGRIAATPWRVIRGPNTGLQNPFAVALANTNDIWVANLGDRPGLPGNHPTITVYASDANGNAAPLRTISQIGLDFVFNIDLPSAIDIRTNPESLLVANGTGTLHEFALAAGQDVPTGSLNVSTPTGVAVDLAGRIYVAQATPGESAVVVFTAQANESITTAPAITIAGPNTRLNTPAHLTVDAQGVLYVVNRGSLGSAYYNGASITVYAAGATGDVQPIRGIGGLQGPNAGLLYPYGIAVDAVGWTFVSDSNSIIVFAPGASGNVFPERVFSHPEISNPGGLAIR